VQPARKDDPSLDDILPDPRLNPMINPRLGKNLGRWAKVYYTTPPEKRDQAVLELVRELEGGAVPVPETEPSAPVEPEIAQTFAPAQLDNPLGPITAVPEQRFCGHCGSPLKKNAPGQSHPADRGSAGILPACLPHQNDRRDVRREAGETPTLPSPLLASDPQAPTVEETAHDGQLLCEAVSLATDTTGKKRCSRVQIVVVLLISTAIGAWGLWRIRFTPAPLSASRAVIIVKRAPSSAAPVVQSRIHPAAPSPPQIVHDPSPKLSKPAAGTPVGCTSDHLSNCRTDELYRKSMSLADGIDARFIAYDKRMNQLLRAATAHPQKEAKPRPDRLRQANYSAQLWEHLQLRAYTSHEKRDALKFRTELTRRVVLSKSDKNLLRSYDNPQSCLELHYIADDLRKLAAKLPRSAPDPLRASTRRVANTSP
jgi:hypothetical protein